jgi:hypothetical protein
VGEVGRSYTPHLVRIRHSISTRSRAPIVKAAVEASILLRSMRKLRRECDEIEKGASVACEEYCVQGSIVCEEVSSLW